MTERRPHQLPSLRDIGWEHWDPAGIRHIGDAQDRPPPADEYDEYLLAVADGLRRGWPAGQARAYLVSAEAEAMCMGVGPTTRERAEATVDAIQAYLRTLGAG